MTPMLTTAPTPLEAESAVMKKLNLYRLRIQVEVGPSRYDVRNYWVEAPSQCSAAKHTALRDEVDDILLIELWSGEIPGGEQITFSTTAECP